MGTNHTGNESDTTYELGQMTWPEVDKVRAHARLAIVPTGACEQHGHHMSLETDTVRARTFTALLAKRLSPQAVITPTLNIGVSGHHMSFPGTLSLSPVTFQQVLYETVESLYTHGWRAVFILNGHGGNQSATGVAVSRLQSAYPDLHIAWSGITSLVADISRDNTVGQKAAHSSEIESSQALYLAPELVRNDVLSTMERPDDYPSTNAPQGVHAPRPFDRVSNDGATGTPSAATRELGEELVNTALDRLTDFLKRFIESAELSATPAAAVTPATPASAVTQS